MTLNRKLVIISLIYFAEGFPFGINHAVFNYYFRDHDMSLASIGLLSLLTLPYSLKVLWAPAVDFIGLRRHWMAAVQLLMAGCLLLIIPQTPSGTNFTLWACLAAFAIFSATQDIAIDAYSIELLKPSEMGIANGFRIAAYRVAQQPVAGGLVIALAGFMGWTGTYIAAAAILGICAVISLRLPSVEVMRPAVSISSLLAPFRDFFSRPGVLYVVAFILLYKLGDFALGPMAHTFRLDRGLSLQEIGVITGIVGFGGSILGGLAGGVLTSRYGIYRGLWILGLCQPLGNLTYWVVAAFPSTGTWGVYAASMAESFCSGLGTVAFLAFLMSICKKEFSATQYALLSALFNVSGTTVAALSGLGTEYLGYAHYFAVTFAASFPVFLFIFHARSWIPTNNEDPKS